MMEAFVKVSGSSLPKNRKKERLEFCDSIFELKERWYTEIQVEDHGVKAEIWRHFDIKAIRRAYMKPFYYRAIVNPEIKRGLLCSTILAVLVTNLGVTNSTVLVAYALLFPIGTGFITFLYLLFGSIADLIDSIKTFVSRFQIPDASTPKES
jgi:hypothetical protein